MTNPLIQAELVASREADAAATNAVLEATTDADRAVAQVAFEKARARYTAAKEAAFAHIPYD